MKKLNRRQFINLCITGAAAFIGASSVSQKAFASLSDQKNPAEKNPDDKTSHEQFLKESENDFISKGSKSGENVLLAQYGSVRRQNRRVSRRTSRRTARRVSERND